MNDQWHDAYGQIEVRGGTLSQEEIDFATKDAQYRESSSYNQRPKTMQVEFLEQTIVINKARYESIQQMIIENSKQTMDYLINA